MCSCIFVWRLSPQLTIRMRQRLADLRPPQPLQTLRSGSGSTSAPHVLTLSSNSDKDEEQEEEPSSSPAHSSQVSEHLVLPSGPSCCPPAPVCVGLLQEQAGARTPRRRWSSREAGSEDELLMVKSMLDLRMLDSYSAEDDEQLEVPNLCPSLTESVVDLTVAPPPQVVPPPVNSSSCDRGMGPVPEVGQIRSKQELGSTVSLQVTSAWVSPAPPQL